MSYDVERLRATEFPWAARGDAIYLNNASTGPLPGRAARAAAAFSALRTEPYRLTDEDEFATLRRSRELCAQLIGSSPAEIALMVNTSYGLNLAARALPLRPGDVILAPDREFPANVYPWMALGRAGVRFERIPCTPDGLPDEAALLRAMDRPGVRAVTTSWVSFSTGFRVDLEALGRACRERGLFLIVDAIQGLGAATLDVGQLSVDLLACGGQKWLLSPWGTGFVYVRDELVRQLEPSAVGWLATQGADDFTRLVDYDFTYRDDARRFEVGTLPYQDFAAFNASLELLLELGPAAVACHVEQIVSDAIAWAACRDDVRLVTPAHRARRAGIVCLAPRDARAASERLERARVVHALREGAIRLSPHCYNTREEMAQAVAVLVGEEQ
ncbi:MAG: aminotransferase class V-fold PLP-dependent enzyme [Chloroflexota bacterium]|nr:aminotransferase class V-fold PLP-dependent enzyme [Chloroflexota bacterium]